MNSIKNLSMVFFLVAASCSAQKDYETKKNEILQKVMSRIAADSSIHHGKIGSFEFFPTQLLSEEKENAGKVSEVFLVLRIADNGCVLILDDGNFFINSAGRKISYKYLVDAVEKWPFAVFDANRECNPAVLLSID